MEKKTMVIYSEEESEEEHCGEPFVGGEEPLIGLVGDINEEAAQQVALMLLTFNGGKILNTDTQEEKPEDLEFFISSGGGNVSEMFTIYDLMSLVKTRRDIATFGYGKVSSAAVPLLAAGTKGKRHIAKNARLMLHHCSAATSGAEPSIRSTFNELKKVEEMMVEALATDTSLSRAEIYNILSRNTDEYFSAEEALEMGIVDKII
jgi:ATP-dependent Clp protease protease subunit